MLQTQKHSNEFFRTHGSEAHFCVGLMSGLDGLEWLKRRDAFTHYYIHADINFNARRLLYVTSVSVQTVRGQVHTAPELHLLPVKSPWHHVGIDFVGPILKSNSVIFISPTGLKLSLGEQDLSIYSVHHIFKPEIISCM